MDNSKRPSAADYDSIAPTYSRRYELYDYSQPGGWQETDNLLPPDNTDDLSPEVERLWQSLHAELTALLEESWTRLDEWPDSGSTAEKGCEASNESTA